MGKTKTFCFQFLSWDSQLQMPPKSEHFTRLELLCALALLMPHFPSPELQPRFHYLTSESDPLSQWADNFFKIIFCHYRKPSPKSSVAFNSTNWLFWDLHKAFTRAGNPFTLQWRCRLNCLTAELSRAFSKFSCVVWRRDTFLHILLRKNHRALHFILPENHGKSQAKNRQPV